MKYMKLTDVPDRLKHNPYWSSMLMIFARPILRPYFTPDYFDFDKEEVEVSALREVSGILSSGQRIMLLLALHLFNSNNPLPEDGLHGLGSLDDKLATLAVDAIMVRFRISPSIQSKRQ